MISDVSEDVIIALVSVAGVLLSAALAAFASLRQSRTRYSNLVTAVELLEKLPERHQEDWNRHVDEEVRSLLAPPWTRIWSIFLLLFGVFYLVMGGILDVGALGLSAFSRSCSAASL